MPNILDATGLTLSTRQEWLDYFTAGYQQIYGSDINLASDTPDGQAINLSIQAILDLQDLMIQIYNSFDPDNAIGNILDQRVAINGIQRQAGTFTITNITMVTTQSVNIYGLDQTDQPVYTISDAAGNLWELKTTVLGTGVGTFVYVFQAAVPGAELTVPNTITTQVTIVLGVASVNNPTTYTTLGINEETDAALRIRRQKSVSLASQGYLPGLLAALLNIPGMTGAFVYENDTGSTVDTVPGHSIWVITSGSATDEDIATAIYDKRNAGCGMKGNVTYDITQVNGYPFEVRWDIVQAVNLFIAFTATSIDGTIDPNLSAIRTNLPIDYVPGVNQDVDINGMATIVQDIDPNTLVTSAGFSTGASQVIHFAGTAASGTFKLNYNGNQSAAINWNDSAGTIQTKIQAITGLSAATSTGTVTGGTLTLNLQAIIDAGSLIQGLVYASNSNLMTSAPAAVVISYTQTYADVLTPSSKKYQFAVSSPNIIILVMILSPSTSSVLVGGTVNFAAYGGYGAYTYSIIINNSAGSINSSTGVYTAGATPGTDTIQAIDKLGNTATATVSVL